MFLNIILPGLGIAVLLAGVFAAVVALVVTKQEFFSAILKVVLNICDFLYSTWVTWIVILVLMGLGAFIWNEAAPWVAVLYYVALSAGAAYWFYRKIRLKKG